MASFEPLGTIVPQCSERIQEVQNWGPIMASLSDARPVFAGIPTKLQKSFEIKKKSNLNKKSIEINQ